MLAGVLLAGSLVVAYGCGNTEQGGETQTGETQATEGQQLPQGHPTMEGSTQAQTAEVPAGVPVNPEGEPMVGKWTNVNTGSNISISVDNDRLVYHGAWGDTPLTKIDDLKASGNMGGMGLNISLDKDTDMLSVELVGFGEVYQYKRSS